MYPQMLNEKDAAPTTSFSLTIVLSSSSMFFYETNFPYEGGHSIAHSIFKTCVHFLKG